MNLFSVFFFTKKLLFLAHITGLHITQGMGNLPVNLGLSKAIRYRVMGIGQAWNGCMYR